MEERIMELLANVEKVIEAFETPIPDDDLEPCDRVDAITGHAVYELKKAQASALHEVLKAEEMIKRLSRFPRAGDKRETDARQS